MLDKLDNLLMDFSEEENDHLINKEGNEAYYLDKNCWFVQLSELNLNVSYNVAKQKSSILLIFSI